MTSSLVYSALTDPLTCALLFLFALSWFLSTFLLLSVLLFAAGVCYRFQDVGVFLWLCSGVAFAFAVCPDLIILIFLLLCVFGLTIVFQNYDDFYQFVGNTFTYNRFWSNLNFIITVLTRFHYYSVYEYCRSLFCTFLSAVVDWKQSRAIKRAPSSEVEFGFSRLNSLKNDNVSAKSLVSGDTDNGSPSSLCSLWYHSSSDCSFCCDCAVFHLPLPSLSFYDDSCSAGRNSLINVYKASSSALTSPDDDFSFVDRVPKNDLNAAIRSDDSDLNHLSSRLERLVISGLSGENASYYGATSDLTTRLFGRGDPTSFSACRCTGRGRTKEGMCSCMGHICSGTSCSCNRHSCSGDVTGVSIGSFFRHRGYNLLLDSASAFYGSYCRISPWFLHALDALQVRLNLLCLESGNESSSVQESRNSNSTTNQSAKVQEWKADPGVLSDAATSDLLSDMMSRNLLLNDDSNGISGEENRGNDLLNYPISNPLNYDDEDLLIEGNNDQMVYPSQYTVNLDDIRRSSASYIAIGDHTVVIGDNDGAGSSNNSVMASTVSRETIIYGSNDCQFGRDTNSVDSGLAFGASCYPGSDQQQPHTPGFGV